ncbi:MAG: helix-turn-helix transcriptional regulator [Archangium sp.]|nr:helix-turn-helix transcriptional regulator [Archangium sp.]
MNPELPGHLLRCLILSIEARGHDVPQLMRQLKPPQPVLTLRTRTSWEELVSVLETYFSHHGVAATQQLMQDLASRHSSVRAVAELLGPPRLTYLVLLEALVGRQAVVVISWKTTSPGLSLRLELYRGLRPSLVFFQCCAWFLASIPRARGQADARLLSERLSERELDCLIIPPRESELTVAHGEANVRALAREVFKLHDGAAHQAPSTPSVAALQSRFALTRAEAKVVRALAEGRSIRRIAEEFGVSLETARTHAKRAMQKTDTHRQAELVSLVLHRE